MNNLKESSIKTIVIHDYPNDDDLYNIYQEVKNAQKKMSHRVHLLLLVIKINACSKVLRVLEVLFHRIR